MKALFFIYNQLRIFWWSMEFTTANKFMQLALEQAIIAYSQNEIPIGAIVTHNNVVIAKSYNKTKQLSDATAHAELLAMKEASKVLKTEHLIECDLYVTAEPCVMCSGAIVLARIRNLYFGCYEPKFGGSGSLFNITNNSMLNHQLKIYAGIMESDCSLILKDFFAKKRFN